MADTLGVGENKKETAVFGGGCFWCTEAVFSELRGVLSVAPGYAGGTVPNPSYDAVCTGTTGHAEVIRIEFDPGQISFNDLLTVFFATHDPTTLNRQGNDVGTQYRSIVLYTNEAQKRDAEAFIKKLTDSDPKGNPVVTEVKPLEKFYEAEDYHHEYFKNNPQQPYCQVIIEPKVLKLEKEFSALLKSHAK
jgi:peptide-methionine (S)-S-oxide reductase